MNSPFHTHPQGVLLDIKVTPKSRQSKIGPTEGERLKVYVHSPAEKNLANEEAIELISKAFRIPKSMITILSGHKSRNKTLLLAGADGERIKNFLPQENLW